MTVQTVFHIFIISFIVSLLWCSGAITTKRK